MKCLRCGHCCKTCLIVIIKPVYIKEDLIVDELPQEAFFGLNGTNGSCPYLTWDGDEANCKIHNYKWYKDTPCFAYTQIESSNEEECRTGSYMRRNPDLWEKLVKK